MSPDDFDKIREIVASEVAAQFNKEQVNGRNMRGNIIAICNKLGIAPKQ